MAYIKTIQGPEQPIYYVHWREGGMRCCERCKTKGDALDLLAELEGKGF